MATISKDLMLDGFNGNKDASMHVKSFLLLCYECIHDDVFLLGTFREVLMKSYIA